MKTRASWIALICSTAVLATLLWAGAAAAKPSPHKWVQHHRAEIKAARQSAAETAITVPVPESHAQLTVFRRIGKAFVAVSRPAPTAVSAAATAITVPAPESHAQLTVFRRIGKAFVAVSRPAPTAGAAGVAAVAVPAPETHAQFTVRVRRPAGKGYVGTTASAARMQ
jgi:6-phosphofructokinase